MDIRTDEQFKTFKTIWEFQRRSKKKDKFSYCTETEEIIMTIEMAYYGLSKLNTPIRFSWVHKRSNQKGQIVVNVKISWWNSTVY